MSRKNTNFIKKNIHDIDNMGKDTLTNFMKQHEGTKKKSKKNPSKTKIKIGEPIKPSFYEHLNDKSKIHKPFLNDNKKVYEQFLNDNKKVHEPLFTKPKKKLDYLNNDYFFVISQDKNTKILDLNYIIFYKGEKNGNIELRYYGDLLNRNEMPEITEFQESDVIDLNKSKNWYLV